MIPGVHPLGGVADGWMGVGVGMGVWGDVPCTYTHTHMCTHTHTRTCMLNMLNMDAFMLVAFAIPYMCVCACACVRMCVHACGDTPMPPDTPRHPPPTCPLPRAAGSPKHQISITLELIKIIRFCLKILYL